MWQGHLLAVDSFRADQRGGPQQQWLHRHPASGSAELSAGQMRSFLDFLSVAHWHAVISRVSSFCVCFVTARSR